MARQECSHKPTVDNILAVYRAAEGWHVREGIAWYPDARQIARDISPMDIVMGAGVIAALSPQTPWGRNVTLAHRAFADGFGSGHTGPVVTKVNRILSGESPEEVLGGDKTTNFFRNIVNPLGNDVTIDRHAYDIAIGEPLGGAPRTLINRKGGYEMMSDIYREAASIAGIVVTQLQAITWLVWREAIGIVDD